MRNVKIGYLRVSTEDQRPDRQIDALEEICDELHIEKLSATAKKRPVYNKVVKSLKPGDMFVIWDLDRAYRSAKDALIGLDALRERDIEILIASMQIDTRTPVGKLIYTVLSGLAEFERSTLSQRTKEGLAATRRRGTKLGRKRKLSDKQISQAINKLNTGEFKIKEIAAEYDVHPWTLTRSIKRIKSLDCSV